MLIKTTTVAHMLFMPIIHDYDPLCSATSVLGVVGAAVVFDSMLRCQRDLATIAWAR